MVMSMKIIDISGNRYGRLVVIGRGPNIGNEASWSVSCDCGKQKVIRGTSLRSINGTKSCGCLMPERVRQSNFNRGRHLMSKTRMYRIWIGMRSRCEVSSHSSFHNYGGRGIRVCRRWHSFDSFFKDMKDGYSDSLQIDRIDNNGNYEPGNCRWATTKEQASNKRTTRLITANGTTKPLTDWASDLGLSTNALKERIDDSGWIPELAVTIPKLSGRQKRGAFRK